MAIKLVGDTSGNTAEVDSTKNLFVTTPQSVDSTNSKKVGYVFLAAGPQNKALQTFGPLGRLSTGAQTIEVFDPIDGAAVNTNIWNTPVPVTYTLVQNAVTGFMVLNNTASTAINSNIQINSVKRIQLINTFTPTVRILFKTPNTPQANATIEIGFGTAVGAAAATDGAFFTWNSAGEFRAVTIFNSVVQQSAVLVNPAINVTHAMHITIRGTKCEFWLNDVLVAEVSNAAGNPNPTSSSRFPLFARVFSGSTAPVVAPELHIGAVSLWRNDLQTNKLWTAQMAGLGRGAYQSPLTPFGQTANHANSTSPASAALSNTAAGYTTLGGRFQFAAPVGAATDFALFGFQVPTDVQFVATGIRIDSVNTGAAVATTATILDWAIGVNSTAVSLATADSATTTAPRRIPIGIQSWVVGAAVGAAVETISESFDTPLIVDGGRFLHVILQVPIGTATAGQIARGNVFINGYFE